MDFWDVLAKKEKKKVFVTSSSDVRFFALFKSGKVFPFDQLQSCQESFQICSSQKNALFSVIKKMTL